MGSLPPLHDYYFNPVDPARDLRGNGGSSHAPPPPRRRFVDSAMDGELPPPPTTSMNDANFDILEWHPAYQSCQRYFLDHAQYEPGTQAVCALINIRLPHQWAANPVTQSSPPQSSHGPGGPSGGLNFNFNTFSRSAGSSYNSSQGRGGGGGSDRASNFVSPVPYIRRLVVTGFDKPAILHGLFGDEYKKGVMPHVECERRNYLFTAKHGGWRTCKKQYDIGSGGGGDETVPFLKPLDEAKMEELSAAERAWSEWLAMEDWMVGPRAPTEDGATSPHTRSGARGGGWHTRDGGLPDGI